MKKKVVCMAAAVFCVCVSLFFSENSQKEVTNDLVLENVEALAGGEGEQQVLCVGSGSVVCPVTKQKVEYVFQRSMLFDE